MRVLTLLLVSVCLIPITGLANDVTVGCAGASGTYSSVTMALNALHAISNRNHTITISGTCAERVDVTDFENVSLIGTEGAKITYGPNTPTWAPRIQVTLSKNIKITGLDIQGGNSRPVIQVSDSTVNIEGCTIEGGGDGVATNGNSRVNIAGSVIQDNQGAGVSAGNNSSVEISGFKERKALIQRNGSGVVASGGSSVSVLSHTDVLDNLYYGVDVHDNLYYGVNAVGGNVVFGGNGQTRIANNARGVTTRGGAVSGGGNGVLLIENNREVGVESWLGGSILLMNATIDNNGGPTSSLPFTAGVAVHVNSTAFFFNVTIRNSPVTGLLVRDNASVSLSGSTVTGNGADGIRIETLSGVRFRGAPSTVTGNSGSDLVCDSDTYVVGGSLANVGKHKCAQFNKK